MKNRLPNNIEDDFLVYCLITCTDRMIVEKIDIYFIIDEFYSMKV